jgi:hypothetical protein
LPVLAREADLSIVISTRAPAGEIQVFDVPDGEGPSPDAELVIFMSTTPSNPAAAAGRAMVRAMVRARARASGVTRAVAVFFKSYSFSMSRAALSFSRKVYRSGRGGAPAAADSRRGGGAYLLIRSVH